MKQLFLADLSDSTDAQIREHIVNSWNGDASPYHILIAYESVGDYGCDSSGWFLLRHKDTKELYKASGSHCSCHGFEGQFEPEKTTLEYLKSDKFYVCTGGYDDSRDSNTAAIHEFIKKIKK
jgi:hypothetical protein